MGLIDVEDNPHNARLYIEVHPYQIEDTLEYILQNVLDWKAVGAMVELKDKLWIPSYNDEGPTIDVSVLALYWSQEIDTEKNKAAAGVPKYVVPGFATISSTASLVVDWFRSSSEHLKDLVTGAPKDKVLAVAFDIAASRKPFFIIHPVWASNVMFK